MTLLSINISQSESNNIEMMALSEGKKVKDFVLDKIFANTQQLKSETIEAIYDAQNGKNITKHKDLDTMFESLLQ